MFWSFESPYYAESLKEVIIHITVNAAWYPDAQAPSLPKPEIPAEQEQGNPTHPVLFCESDRAAAGTARPAIFVVQPCLQPLFRPILRTAANKAKPFFPQIFRIQSGSGMHEKSAEPHGAHAVDLPQQFRLVQRAVPSPKRFPAVCRSRLTQPHFCFFVHISPLNEFHLYELLVERPFGRQKKNRNLRLHSSEFPIRPATA